LAFLQYKALSFQLQRLCFTRAGIPQFHRPRSGARANNPFGWAKDWTSGGFTLARGDLFH